jgi:hypothetical protein
MKVNKNLCFFFTFFNRLLFHTFADSPNRMIHLIFKKLTLELLKFDYILTKELGKNEKKA